MKLKQQPEDFRVEELTDAVAGGEGEFAFYRLEKTGWTTPDALAAIRRRWRIDHRRLSYGGLKDRHAVTAQFFTIERGPRRNLKHERIAVTFLGRRRKPFTSADIRANRFAIVIRDLTEAALAAAVAALPEVEAVGLPNYFDDQRFGSVGDPPEFVAREMVFGRFERALWLALAEEQESNRAETKREKELLREYWGDWKGLKDKLPRGHARSLVDYLVHHPGDFKGAISRLRPELQGLYLSAYQSYLWNRALAAWLTASFPPADLDQIELKLGRVPAPRRVPAERRAEWESLVIPLPSARVKPQPGEIWLPFVESVLSGEGLTMAEMRIKGMQKPFFSKGDRPARVQPTNVSHEIGPDELNRRKQKLSVKFELPRGCYATMLVKRITSGSPGP